MLYSKFDVLAFAIAIMAEALDRPISSLAVRKARAQPGILNGGRNAEGVEEMYFPPKCS